jgi:hypothetical protein
VTEQFIPERPFSSTTFEWKRVKVASPPKARDAVRSAARGFRRLPPWPMRKPLTLTIKLRGGPECWVEVHSRGQIQRFPGVTAVYDVLRTIANDK